ncbi:type II toxin-antitoxin system PemK/MazF family toxin [Paenibacillus lautus]|uniref:type II toxin-antitoxin system PemK/MazF family toxin n=1 Tax=Paenibacillus lautus TaxID=1401 RepID=UPI001C7E153A|nr:type II toxin-antitoxin system PemK/MazF family toxin [Paenibacillus lautus]
MAGSTRITFNPGFEPEKLLTQGHLWVAPVWNHTENKFTPRPVVIVGNAEANDRIGLIINFVTKQGARDKFDVPVEYWKEAGLDCESWVRTAKPTTIVKTNLKLDPVSRQGIIRPRGYIGKLHEHDLTNVLAMCKSIF